MIKRKDVFPKGRATPEKFKTIVITTNGNNRNDRLAEQEHMKYTLFLRHILAKTTKVKMCKKVPKRAKFCSMGRVQYAEETLKNNSVCKNT